MYQVRRVNIGKTAQLEELARECGRLYSQTVVSFWRTVRHKGIWLAPKHLMRWHTCDKLHAHTADACVQAFFANLKSWRERKKLGDPHAHPPRRRRRYFRIEYKRSAMRLLDGQLPRDAQRGYLAEQEDAEVLTNVLGRLISRTRLHFSSCSENIGMNSASVPHSASPCCA
jgi:hypothetical protein